jgi:hypothetical protein
MPGAITAATMAQCKTPRAKTAGRPAFALKLQADDAFLEA